MNEYQYVSDTESEYESDSWYDSWDEVPSTEDEEEKEELVVSEEKKCLDPEEEEYQEYQREMAVKRKREIEEDEKLSDEERATKRLRFLAEPAASCPIEGVPLKELDYEKVLFATFLAERGVVIEKRLMACIGSGKKYHACQFLCINDELRERFGFKSEKEMERFIKAKKIYVERVPWRHQAFMHMPRFVCKEAGSFVVQEDLDHKRWSTMVRRSSLRLISKRSDPTLEADLKLFLDEYDKFQALQFELDQIEYIRIRREYAEANQSDDSDSD